MTNENSLTIDQVELLLLTQLEKVGEAITGIQLILSKQEQNLAHHIKRTDLLEESVDLLRTQIQPIERHVHFVNQACKVFATVMGFAAASAGITTAVLKVVELLLQR